MPYRHAGRTRWMISASWRGRVIRIASGVEIKSIAEGYETALRELCRRDYGEILDALTTNSPRKLRIHEVARWMREDGERGLFSRFREWELAGTTDSPLRPHVDQYLAEKRASGKTREVTIKAYETCLHRMVGPKMTVGEFGPAHIASVLAKHAGARKSWVAVSGFIKWSIQRDLFGRNPLASLDAPPPGKPRDRYLTDDQVLQLCAAAPERYRVGFLLSHAAGVERGVAVVLSPHDIDPATRTILVRGTKVRGVRQRRVRVADYAWPHVLALWEKRKHCKTLLEPMSGYALSAAHRKAARACGFGDLEYRDGRHSFAVRLCKAGAPLQHVSAQLGHAAGSTLVASTYGKYQPGGVAMDHYESLAGKLAELEREARDKRPQEAA